MKKDLSQRIREIQETRRIENFIRMQEAIIKRMSSNRQDIGNSKNSNIKKISPFQKAINKILCK